MRLARGMAQVGLRGVVAGQVAPRRHPPYPSLRRPSVSPAAQLLLVQAGRLRRRRIRSSPPQQSRASRSNP